MFTSACHSICTQFFSLIALKVKLTQEHVEKLHKHELKLISTIKEKNYVIEALNANVTQYKCMMEKIVRISRAGIHRYEMLFDRMNIDTENSNAPTGEAKSELKNDAACNKVIYSGQEDCELY